MNSPNRSRKLSSAASGLLLALLAGGCQGSAVVSAPGPAAPGPTLAVLALGQSTAVGPQASLRFVRIVNDSRCPADVQCVWAGEVTIALELSSPRGKSTVELSQRQNPAANIEGLNLELVDFGPCQPTKAKGDAAVAECASLRIGGSVP